MKKLRLYFLASALLMLSQGAWAAITGTGTASDPYVLSSAEDWATFANETNSGTYWATGVYVKMGADISSVTAWVGTGIMFKHDEQLISDALDNVRDKE